MLFAIGRTPGWLAQWLELVQDKEQKIARPKQIYTGDPKAGLRAVVRALEVTACSPGYVAVSSLTAVVFDVGNVLIRMGPTPCGGGGRR